MCVTECFLPFIVENLLLRDRVERISNELLPLLLYTVDIYKNYETFPCAPSLALLQSILPFYLFGQYGNDVINEPAHVLIPSNFTL